MRHTAVITILCVLIAAVLPCGLLVGGVDLSASDVFDIIMGAYSGEYSEVGEFIVLETRLPALVTALMAGAALAISGLLMQTGFNNPLAGPSIMGISGGASVGVALVIMTLGGTFGIWGRLAVAGGALLGAMAVLVVLLLFSMLVRSSDALLIVGILLGYATSSVISLLNFFSTDRSVHSFVMWGLGSFAGVSPDTLMLFSALCLVLILLAYPLSKALNALLFGEKFAENAGVNIGRTRTALLLLSGALTAVVTAWCGPIGFIGLIAPHVARMLLASSNHRVLIPATALCGGFIGLICQILSVAPSLSTGGAIPINAITPVIGVPIIIYVIVNRRKLLYFN
ncbi:MAG: iron ABC transporter permease [Muribaculaceae bacterium]|nr:iron ABC transporter permease [Muribaculaceae bacterium]